MQANCVLGGLWSTNTFSLSLVTQLQPRAVNSGLSLATLDRIALCTC